MHEDYVAAGVKAAKGEGISQKVVRRSRAVHTWKPGSRDPWVVLGPRCGTPPVTASVKKKKKFLLSEPGAGRRQRATRLIAAWGGVK